MSLDNPSQFYVDISTGLNQYINLMMDAYRGYIVQRKLSRLESYHLKTYYTLTKPVKEEGEECKIYIQEYDVKAFLEWPFKNSRYSISNLLNEDPNSKKKFCKEQQELNGLIYRFISYTKLCFNSVKYNIPILLFERPFIDGEGWIEYDWLSNKVDILKEELINITNGLLKPVVKKSGDTYTVKSRSLNYNYLLNLYITISLYNGLRTTLGLPLRNPSFKINRYVEGPFKSVIEGYKKLNLPLNNRFLDRDLREIWIYYDKLGSDWTTLSELMNKGNNNGYDDRKKPSIYKSDEVRNFFAHSGFLRDITMARKKNGCIEIRYDVKEKTLERIGNWIKNPENY
jgi:CRISPR-associated protein Csx1